MKPLDEDLIRDLARKHEVLVTIEEGSVGGFGSHVLEFLSREGLLDHGLKVRTITLPDTFIDHDKPEVMYAEAGLDAAGIVKKVTSALGLTATTGGALRPDLEHPPYNPSTREHGERVLGSHHRRPLTSQAPIDPGTGRSRT